jgi:hypothetical protein
VLELIADYLTKEKQVALTALPFGMATMTPDTAPAAA